MFSKIIYCGFIAWTAYESILTFYIAHLYNDANFIYQQLKENNNFKIRCLSKCLDPKTELHTFTVKYFEPTSEYHKTSVYFKENDISTTDAQTIFNNLKNTVDYWNQKSLFVNIRPTLSTLKVDE
jgi:hypothetical protein